MRGEQSLAISLTRERDREAVREVGQFYFGDGRKYFIDIFFVENILKILRSPAWPGMRPPWAS